MRVLAMSRVVAIEFIVIEADGLAGWLRDYEFGRRAKRPRAQPWGEKALVQILTPTFTKWPWAS